MYLKELELLGFKSFAPKTTLTFHDGVTAIVGPNGCGKSNVLDAIRWVLGEQSAKALRGGEMADVIFSGTDSQAALGMAEVSMTFAECEQQLGLDWNEVTITRRVFRDGRSEYLLNKTPCRLRDIHGLFMDTGIGRSAYSIMEQGKIDQILSSRPEDRRAIFEEAAGITKFKAQRKEALRKLDATEANLVRLEDIIREVKRQIGSLQRQAGKARRYQALTADLRMFETHLAKRQWEMLEIERQTTSDDLNRLAAHLEEAELELEEKEQTVIAQRAALEAMEARLEEARRAVNEAGAAITNHESRLFFNEERLSEFAQVVERARVEIAAGEEKLRGAETQLQDTDTELAEVTTLLASELRRMEEKQESAAALDGTRRSLDAEQHRVAERLQREEHRLASLRGQMTSIAQQSAGAEARRGILSGELDALQANLGRLAEQKTAVHFDFNRFLEEQQAAEARLAGRETEWKARQGRLAEMDGALRGAQRAFSEKESRLEILRALDASGEGLSKGAQAVLRGLDQPEFFKPAILGALTQFIEVQPEFVRAVEAALGANLEALVLKDRLVAEAMIKTLSSKKMGEASLAIPLAESSARDNLREQTAPPEGAIGWLIDKVTARPEVRALTERLLGGIALAPDLESALRMSPLPEGAVVTLQGETLTADGILRGGVAANPAISILERKNQITVLAAEAQRAREELDALHQQRAALVREIEAAAAEVEASREEKQYATLNVSTTRSRMGSLEQEIRDMDKRASELERERGVMEGRCREAEEKLAKLEAETQVALTEIESLQEKRAESGRQLETARARAAEVSGELNELKIKVATERQRHTSLHHQRKPMEARLQELRELLSQRAREIENYEARAITTAAENEEITAGLGALQSRKAEADGALAALSSERSAMAAATEGAAGELHSLRQQLSRSQEQRGRTEVKLTQCEMRLAAQAEHVQKRYQLDLRDFQSDLHGMRLALRDAMKRTRSNGGSASDPTGTDGPDGAPAGEGERAMAADDPAPREAFDLDWAAVEALVRDLEQRVDSMGPVNLDAIQEYDELEERYAFLEKQNTDLLNAKTELLAVIQKINVTTRQLFAETFEKVRVNFQEMFTELFGGGKANLLLSDDSDPLECGIEIIAKPPGKQLQSISLLSGGERTMTAVALLFSIFMVKPSPFCVLDEMDAPLDESNISRFIKILDRFVTHSQFIVISHHKRTIARADAIYGVTMEQHGVSKLVGVKFARRDESHESADIMGSANAAPVPSVAETFGKRGALHSERESEAEASA